MKYFIGFKMCDYYFVHIIENGVESKEMVHESDIDGFVQCLEYLGFRQ